MSHSGEDQPARIPLHPAIHHPDINKGYYDLENAVLLPHMGTSTIEARNEMGFAGA